MNFTNEQSDFIEKAMQSISDDPRTRLSPLVKNILDEDNYVFDAHCHLFDGDCINVKYMATRMIEGAVGRFKERIWKLVTGRPYSDEVSPFSAEELVDKVYYDPSIISDKNLTAAFDRMEIELDLMEAEEIAKKSLYELDVLEFIKRYRMIIKILRSGSMETVYKTFEKNYAIHNVMNDRTGRNPKLLTVALGMDLNSGWEDSVPKTWEKQNEELALLGKNQPVLPYFPIDPRRENLYVEFLKAFDQADPQFFGVKCYPALGYLPADERLMPIFKICEEKNIPVMTHCGGESVSTYVHPITVHRLGEEIIIDDSKRKLRARRLNEPTEWEYVLNEYNNLRLCFGHFGGGAAWKNELATAHRIPTILNMMRKYKNLYADFSFNLESLTAIENFRKRLFSTDADGDIMRERSLFGTDFWVILPLTNLNEDQNNFVAETERLLNELLKTNVLRYMKLM